MACRVNQTCFEILFKVLSHADLCIHIGEMHCQQYMFFTITVNFESNFIIKTGYAIFEIQAKQKKKKTLLREGALVKCFSSELPFIGTMGQKK